MLKILITNSEIAENNHTHHYKIGAECMIQTIH